MVNSRWAAMTWTWASVSTRIVTSPVSAYRPAYGWVVVDAALNRYLSARDALDAGGGRRAT